MLYGEPQLSSGIVDDESGDIRCVWLAMQLGWRGDAKCHVFISTHTHPGSLIDAKVYRVGFIFILCEC